jgi:hypothetical protein
LFGGFGAVTGRFPDFFPASGLGKSALDRSAIFSEVGSSSLWFLSYADIGDFLSVFLVFSYIFGKEIMIIFEKIRKNESF